MHACMVLVHGASPYFGFVINRVWQSLFHYYGRSYSSCMDVSKQRYLSESVAMTISIVNCVFTMYNSSVYSMHRLPLRCVASSPGHSQLLVLYIEKREGLVREITCANHTTQYYVSKNASKSNFILSQDLVFAVQ